MCGNMHISSGLVWSQDRKGLLLRSNLLQFPCQGFVMASTPAYPQYPLPKVFSLEFLCSFAHWKQRQQHTTLVPRSLFSSALAFSKNGLKLLNLSSVMHTWKITTVRLATSRKKYDTLWHFNVGYCKFVLSFLLFFMFHHFSFFPAFLLQGDE